MEQTNFAALGAQMRAAREAKRISQLELALEAGVSQRHLSFVETGKSTPSRDLLHTLMEALDLPLSSRNALLMRAGYAPVYGQRTLASEDMAPVRSALEALLAAHAPSPALVIDAKWNLIMANRGLDALAHAIGGDALAAKLANAPQPVNMLTTFFSDDSIQRALLNFDEVAAEIARRLRQESYQHPELAALAKELEAKVPRRNWTHSVSTPSVAPVLATRFQTPRGVLSFFSMFTTFGTPQDITAASLRVEHLFAADELTRAVVMEW